MSKDPIVSQLEELIPAAINMLVAYEAPELATLATLVEALGKALVDELANATKLGPEAEVLAADAAALTALRLRFAR